MDRRIARPYLITGCSIAKCALLVYNCDIRL